MSAPAAAATRRLDPESRAWLAQLHAEGAAHELARTLGHLITHELTAHQRDILLALTVEHVAAKNLAERVDSTPGALHKTLHDARRKLKQQLAHAPADRDIDPGRAGSCAEALGRAAATGIDRLGPVTTPMIDEALLDAHEDDHASIGDGLAALRDLIDDYRPQRELGGTHRALLDVHVGPTHNATGGLR